MTDVKKLLAEATSQLQAERDKLRRAIDVKESDHQREVDPLRAQLAELDQAIARICGEVTPSPETGRQRAPRGQNRRLILDAIEKQPGITATAIAERTGIAKPTAYATLAKLTHGKELRKETTADGVIYRLA